MEDFEKKLKLQQLLVDDEDGSEEDYEPEEPDYGDDIEEPDYTDDGDIEEPDFDPIDEPQDIIQTPLGGISTFVDIVFCIDLTASMAPLINTVKELTLNLYDDLIKEMREKKSRIVKQLRVKVIGFRDFYCDGQYALEESSFFTLPEQKNEFSSFVRKLEAKGGGDEPENALEAIALAMKSNWVKVTNSNTEKARNVVIVFTDASAHPLEKQLDGVDENYPKGMLKSYNELYEAWCGQGSLAGSTGEYVMDKMAERLVIFAPEDAYPWSDMAEEIDYAAFVPISAAKGGAEIGKRTIIAQISGSIK